VVSIEADYDPEPPPGAEVSVQHACLQNELCASCLGGRLRTGGGSKGWLCSVSATDYLDHPGQFPEAVLTRRITTLAQARMKTALAFARAA